MIFIWRKKIKSYSWICKIYNLKLTKNVLEIFYKVKTNKKYIRNILHFQSMVSMFVPKVIATVFVCLFVYVLSMATFHFVNRETFSYLGYYNNMVSKNILIYHFCFCCRNNMLQMHLPWKFNYNQIIVTRKLN